MERDLNVIGQIILVWMAEGLDSDQDDECVPMHPELYFRLTNEWWGWNEYLGKETCNPNLLELDRLEDIAFRIYLQVTDSLIDYKLN